MMFWDEIDVNLLKSYEIKWDILRTLLDWAYEHMLGTILSIDLDKSIINSNPINYIASVG